MLMVGSLICMQVDVVAVVAGVHAQYGSCQATQFAWTTCMAWGRVKEEEPVAVCTMLAIVPTPQGPCTAVGRRAVRSPGRAAAVPSSVQGTEVHAADTSPSAPHQQQEPSQATLTAAATSASGPANRWRMFHWNRYWRNLAHEEQYSVGPGEVEGQLPHDLRGTFFRCEKVAGDNTEEGEEVGRWQWAADLKVFS